LIGEACYHGPIQELLAVQHREDLESGTGADVENKYKKIYEDDINPFTAFSKKVAVLLFCCLVIL
jgi:hypothetical protein